MDKKCQSCGITKHFYQFYPLPPSGEFICHKCNYPLLKARRARGLTVRAMVTKDLKRPTVCDLCKIDYKDYTPQREQSPSTYIQAHHVDYDNPLMIVWLCIKCHRKVHKKTEKHSEIRRSVVFFYHKKYKNVFSSYLQPMAI